MGFKIWFSWGVGHFIFKFTSFWTVFTFAFELRFWASNHRLGEICVLFFYEKEGEKRRKGQERQNRKTEKQGKTKKVGKGVNPSPIKS